MIIALNKMDLLEWSEEEFIRIRNLTLEYLLEIGFQEDKLVYVPISAFHNINIVTPSPSFIIQNNSPITKDPLYSN